MASRVPQPPTSAPPAAVPDGARHGFRVGRHRAADHSSTFAFSVRLGVAITLTFALLGVTGYLMIGDQLQRRMLDNYAVEHRGDARAFAQADRRTRTVAGERREIRELLATIARRPGVKDAALVDRRNVVVAAADARRIGTRHQNPRIDAALRRGRSYVGRKPDPAADGRDFAFIVPVELDDGRLAFEVTRDHTLLDKQLGDIRRTVVLLVVVALFGAALVFWLVGGRSLVRSHRIALRRASRDGLTDLPNQRALQDDLARALQSATRHGDDLSVVAVDLDDFKFLNDRHGHAHGDAMLRRAARVLHEVRAGDSAYRLGGDEFAIVLPRTGDEGARAVARRLMAALREAHIAGSLGVSGLRPGHAADSLLAEAGAAVYDAKRHGGGTIVHFDDIRDRVAVTRPDEVRALHRLLDLGAVTSAFQPIWNLGSGSLLGVEALTRPEPDSGLSNPAQAFDVAEKIGRVHDLDVLCVRSALRSAAEIPPGALLFLNIAPQTLDLDTGDDWLLRAVRAAGIEPDRVVVEVTERFGGRTASVLKSLRRLREQGFKLALDDVGAGNSGLEMLREVGAEFVKLDRSIVVAAPDETNARAVLMAMATFARETGAYVIAEGIEDDDLLTWVRTIDERIPRNAATMIQGGQGYGLGRPAPEVPSAGARLQTPAPASA